MRPASTSTRMVRGLRRVVVHACLGAAATLILGTAAVAQTVTGTIQGTITDSAGGVLPGVTVTIRHLDTGQERTVVTNEVGFYAAPFVPIGPYRLTAELPEFGSVVRGPVQVDLNQTRV